MIKAKNILKDHKLLKIKTWHFEFGKTRMKLGMLIIAQAKTQKTQFQAQAWNQEISYSKTSTTSINVLSLF